MLKSHVKSYGTQIKYEMCSLGALSCEKTINFFKTFCAFYVFRLFYISCTCNFNLTISVKIYFLAKTMFLFAYIHFLWLHLALGASSPVSSGCLHKAQLHCGHPKFASRLADFSESHNPLQSCQYILSAYLTKCDNVPHYRIPLLLNSTVFLLVILEIACLQPRRLPYLCI